MAAIDTTGDVVVLVGASRGLTVIPQPTQLTRLNYFDGKFLRADDLRVEQDYLRTLVQFANQAGGSGVVDGFDLTLGGADALALGPGLALDPTGRTLLLPQSITVSLAKLIDEAKAPRPLLQRRARGATFGDCEQPELATTAGTLNGARFHLISISHAEALCGEEDVYGNLCEEACVTSTDRPYRLEGIVVIATPFMPTTPFATSKAVALGQLHQRSLLASAAFADEFAAGGSLLSAAGLHSQTWCLGAAHPDLPDSVPVGVVARTGGQTQFLDAWTARRERIEPPPRRYWAGRMAMRPWDVFLAQVLQFQCQLADLLKGVQDDGAPPNPCRAQRGALDDALSFLNELGTPAGKGKLESALDHEWMTRVTENVRGALHVLDAGVGQRVLIDGGIVEAPAAGWLPVTPGATPTVNDQVRRLMGEGVDLRFCVVAHDFVGEAFEEGQHMDRISLIAGLDDSKARPKVDVFVPDGEIADAAASDAGDGFDSDLWISPRYTGVAEAPYEMLMRTPETAATSLRGSARAGTAPGGGPQLYLAGTTAVPSEKAGLDLIHAIGTFGAGGRSRHGMTLLDRVEKQSVFGGGDDLLAPIERGSDDADQVLDLSVSVWLSLTCERDPFSPTDTVPIPVAAEGMLSMPASRKASALSRNQFRGEYTIERAAVEADGTRRSFGRLTGLGWRDTVVSGKSVDTSTIQPDVGVELVEAPVAGGRSVTATVIVSDEQVVTLTGSAGGTPLRVDATLSVQRQQMPNWLDETPTRRILIYNKPTPDGTTLAQLRLIADPTYADPTGLPFRLSDTALKVLADALRNDAFVGESERALFPPAVSAASTLHVRATRDWVLFRRRRDCNCGDEPAPVAITTTRYAVFGLARATPKTLVRTNPPQRLGTVVFSGDTALVARGGQDVVAAWAATFGSDAPVTSATLALAVAADHALAVQRARTVQGLVDAQATATPGVTIGVPALLRVSDTDGSLLLTAGEAEVKTTCIMVAIASNPPSDEVDRLIADNQGDAALKAATSKGIEVLGEATFPVPGNTPLTASAAALKAAFEQFANGREFLVDDSWIFAGPKETATTAVQRARAVAAARAIGLAARPEMTTTSSVPGDCPTILVLFLAAVVP